MVIMVSDNESWVDGVRRGATEAMLQWERIRLGATTTPGWSA